MRPSSIIIPILFGVFLFAVLVAQLNADFGAEQLETQLALTTLRHAASLFLAAAAGLFLLIRAVAGDATSAPLELAVSARLEVGVRALRRGRVAVSATASPAQPGVRVALQAYVRLRFDYRRIDRARLDARSTVMFRLRPRRTVRVRVALEGGRDGYAAGGVSPALTIRARMLGRIRPVRRRSLTLE